MTYRDDREVLRQRVDHLEGELAQAKDEIAHLTGEKAREETGASVAHSPLLDAPMGLAFEKALPFEVDEAGYEAIAVVVRTRLGVQVSQVGRSLSTPGDVFSLSREGGQTVLRLRGDWRGLRATVLAWPGLAIFFGSIFSVGLMIDAAHLDPPSVLMHVAWIVPTLAGSTFWLARRRMKRQAETKAEQLRGVLEAVLAAAEKHRVRVRVEEGETVEVEEARGEERERR